MNLFLVIVGKGRQPVGERLLQEFSRDDLDEIFYLVEERRFWANADGTVVYFGWEGARSKFNLRSHFHAANGAMAAFNGHLWPRSGLWSQDRSWGEQLLDYLNEHGPLSAHEEFFGTFTGVYASPGCHTYVFCDPYGCGLVYYAENKRYVALSNHAALANRAINGARIDPDVRALGWIAYHGQMVGLDTSYRGVALIPQCSYVEIDWHTNEARATRAREKFWEYEREVRERAKGDELIEWATADLLRTVTQIAGLPAKRRALLLSGGKDSRASLALILKAGVREAFTLYTFGPRGLPDVEIPHEIAAHYGMDIEWYDTVAPPDRLRELLPVHAYLTSGMRNLWDLHGETKLSDMLCVQGHFGSSMRSNQLKRIATRTMDELKLFFARNIGFDAPCIIWPEYRSWCGRWIEHWIHDLYSIHSCTEDIPELFYLEQRVRRWLGIAYEIEDINLHVNPLQSLTALRVGFAGGQFLRWIDHYHFEIMRRCDPWLAKLHFSFDNWHEANYRHLPDRDDYRRVTPLTYDVKATGPLPWQEKYWDSYYPVFEEHLLDDRKNPLFEVVDYRRVASLIRNREPITKAVKYYLFGALGAAVWIAGRGRVQKFS